MFPLFGHVRNGGMSMKLAAACSSMHAGSLALLVKRMRDEKAWRQSHCLEVRRPFGGRGAPLVPADFSFHK